MIKFNVVEKRGKVVAYLNNCQDDAYNILRKRLPEYIHIDKNAVKMRSMFRASAKCHPEDKFDAEKGKEIAKARAIEKYDMAMAKVLNKVACDLDEYLEYIDTRIEYFDEDCGF